MNITRLYKPTEADKINKLRIRVKWYEDEVVRLTRERAQLDEEIEQADTEYLRLVIELRKVFE